MLDVSNFGLKISHWYFSRNQLLKKYLLWLLVGLNILIWAFSFSQLIPYLWQTARYNALTRDMSVVVIDFQNYKQQHEAENLIISDTVAIATKTNNYTVIGRVKNPNSDWVAERVTYSFQLSGVTTATETSFVFPGENKALVSFNVSYASSSGTSPLPKLNIEKIHWHRYAPTDNLIIPDFAISNIKQSQVNVQSLANPNVNGSIPASGVITRVQAEISNNSVYGFWRVDVQGILNGLDGQLLDFSTIRMTEFQPRETRRVELLWNKTYPLISSIDIYPVVDTFDPTAIMPLGSGVSQPL